MLCEVGDDVPFIALLLLTVSVEAMVTMLSQCNEHQSGGHTTRSVYAADPVFSHYSIISIVATSSPHEP